MPAYNAGRTIVPTLKSVLSQTLEDWRVYLVSDDGSDYAPVLAAAGVADPRIVHLATPSPRSGACAARNVALDAMDTRYAAMLDADDRFASDKLARCAAVLHDHAIVSTAIDVVDETFRHLRYVGVGEDRVLTPGEHKWVNLSMDSMLAWDRRAGDPRFDTTLSNMTDLEFLLRLYRTSDHSFHVGTPQHDYVKISSSMSNKPGATAGMIASKTAILDRLRAGDYGFADTAGVEAFLEISRDAEAAYPSALAASPGLLFEDHLQLRLRG